MDSFISGYQHFIGQPHVIMMGHLLGLAGMSSIVVAYFLLEQGTLNRDRASYYWLNLTGALLLELSLLINFNLGSFVIEIFWIGISITGLRRLKKRRSLSD